MRAREYMVLDRAVEEGVSYGWRRAHKYTDTPTEYTVLQEIEQAVMNEICLYFRLEVDCEDPNDC